MLPLPFRWISSTGEGCKPATCMFSENTVAALWVKSFPRWGIHYRRKLTRKQPVGPNFQEQPSLPRWRHFSFTTVVFLGANQASELFIGRSRNEFGEHRCVSSLRVGGLTLFQLEWLAFLSLSRFISSGTSSANKLSTASSSFLGFYTPS